MTKTIGTLLFITLSFINLSVADAQSIMLKNGESITCKKALTNMFDSVYALKFAKFNLISFERIDGELLQNRSMAYIQYEPRKLFIRGFDANDEMTNEILFETGVNNNKALISPNGFPYFNLYLEPLGGTMRNNRHLTIMDAGGRYLVDMLQLGLQEHEAHGDSTSQFLIERESENLLKLTITNSNYAYVSYTVSNNEQVRDICNKLGLPEYKIVEINDHVDDFEDLSPGQRILIPNFYAKKFILIIRESDFIPINVRIFDDKGLYSEYKYNYFDCHPHITNATFNSDNPAYTF